MSIANTCKFVCNKLSKSRSSASSASSKVLSKLPAKTAFATKSELVFKEVLSQIPAFIFPIEITLFNPANTA